MKRFRAGDEVVHSQWGFGSVLGSRPGGHVRVRFHDQPGLPRTVAGRQLLVVPPQPESEIAAGSVEAEARSRPGPTRSPPPPERRPDRPRRPAPPRSEGAGLEPRHGLAAEELAGYRQTIEALRCGVLPAKHVLEYTVGRDRQLASIRSLLDAGRGLRIVWGDYGTGKSHLLDVAEQIALDGGFLTSRITLDRHEIPPSHPQRLYSAVVRRLRYPGDLGQGLEPMLQRLIDSESHYAHCGEETSRFLSPYLFALRAQHPRTIDWMRDYAHGARVDSVEGTSLLRWIRWPGLPPLSMSDFRTYGRVYAHLVGTIASWARDAGFRGLVLLFDEVEFLDSLDQTLLDFAREVLAHYAAATVPPSRLAFDPDELYKGGHEVHRRLSLRFREDQPLSTVFALTPLPEIEAMLRAMFRSEESNVFLEPLDSAEALSLVDRVHALYRTAHPEFQPPSGLVDAIRDEVWGRIAEGEDSPRGIVKTACFRLDAERVR